MAKYYFRLLLLVGSVIAVIALIGSLLPRSYDFQTSVIVDAPSAKIFPYLNSLRAWPDWSRQWNPDEIEELTITYNGAAEGVGAAQSWTDRRGDGKLWITESTANELVAFEMDFANFPRMSSRIELESSQPAGQTMVTWRSSGRLPAGPFYSYFGSFFSTRMRHEYEKSLAKLKQVVESDSTQAAQASEPGDPDQE